MAGSKSDYLEKVLLDLVLGAVAYTPAVTVYVALSTALYSDASTGASMTEVTGGAYGRVAVTNNATNFPAATGTSPASKSLATAQTFPTATAGWGNVKSAYIVDAATGGNVLYGGDLSLAKDIFTGDTAAFAANAISASED